MEKNMPVRHVNNEKVLAIRQPWAGLAMSMIGTSLIASFGYAWNANERIATLETKAAAVQDANVRIEKKIDKIYDVMIDRGKAW